MQSPNSLPLSEHVYYMLNREYFNMLRAEVPGVNYVGGRVDSCELLPI
jgi:hypothetical protein